MKYLKGKYYLEVKYERYINQPNKNILLRLEKEPKNLKTQYHVQDEREK